MDEATERPTESPRRTILRRADQACAAVLVMVSLAMIAMFWSKELMRLEDRLKIERASSRTVEFQLDINQAPWTEIALLPDVGETLAKRIVASREQEGPFTRHDDLRRVRGIGPRTMERIRPYLLPILQNEPSVRP